MLREDQTAKTSRASKLAAAAAKAEKLKTQQILKKLDAGPAGEVSQMLQGGKDVNADPGGKKFVKGDSVILCR